ncbi:acyltransferase family protein [Streptacidiphilus monticola]|uniref:Acyltransferase n=1 Tax=Streptacidiphilus monticola TaxID=2161674 RepID=A0ABW1FXI8_9ACTN
MTSLTARIEAGTPATRDRALDGLRALALLCVPLGHWLLGGFTRTPDGAIHNASPLVAMGGFAPVTWFLQLLGVFFLVGGHASVLSFNRSAETRSWLRGRIARLGRPVLGVAAVWAAALPLLHALGVPADSLRTAAVLVVQPLWFVGVYAVTTALTPLCRRAARRFGGWSALPLLAAVAVVDLLRYGPWSGAVPGWLGLVNLLPGWLFCYQLGVAWGEGRIGGRRSGTALLLGGAGLFALLLLCFHYPLSMVGVPGAARDNAHPPSLLVLALGAAQSGVALLLHGRLNRLLRRPRLWTAVVLVNLSAMTILCWHQTAMLLPALTTGASTALAGLTTAPVGPGWVAARLAWLPLFALLLTGLVAAARRFEQPWRTGALGRAAAAVLAAAFTLYACTVV